MEEFETLSEQLARVTAECERLREENARLSNLLSNQTHPTHRLHDNKKIVEVYDYVDASITMLARMFAKRLRGYKALGYSIHEPDRRPAGAAPGTNERDGAW